MRRTPQEKKQLSYAKDGRNTYGGNDKASRKSLPRKQARAHRTNRHFDALALSRSTGVLDLASADMTEQVLRGHRRKRFQKWADTPLGEFVRWKLAERSELAQSSGRRTTAAED